MSKTKHENLDPQPQGTYLVLAQGKAKKKVVTFTSFHETAVDEAKHCAKEQKVKTDVFILVAEYAPGGKEW